MVSLHLCLCEGVPLRNCAGEECLLSVLCAALYKLYLFCVSSAGAGRKWLEIGPHSNFVVQYFAEHFDPAATPSLLQRGPVQFGEHPGDARGAAVVV